MIAHARGILTGRHPLLGFRTFKNGERDRYVSSAKLRVIFGSQSGTAESFANDLQFDAFEYDADVIDARNFSVKDLVGDNTKNNTLTAFVVATYGEGEPTDNAKKFIAEINSSDIDASGCNYTVFGLGNQECFKDRYNVTGIALDKRLKALGAKSVVPLTLGDASNNSYGSFSKWKEAVLAELASMGSSSSSSGEIDDHQQKQALERPVIPMIDGSKTCSTSTATPTSRPVFDLSNLRFESKKRREQQSSQPPPSPQQQHQQQQHQQNTPSLSERQLAMIPLNQSVLLCKVSERRQLMHRTNEFNSAYHLSFDLKGCRPLNETTSSYTEGLLAGDHVGVFAPNSEHVVNRFAACANLSAKDLTALSPIVQSSSKETKYTLKDVLTWQVQLTGTVPVTTLKIINRWASENGLSETASHFKLLIDSYEEKTMHSGLDVSAALDMIPVSPQRYPTLPLGALLKSLPAIGPRLYSYTHDPQSHSDSASLLCRLLRFRDTRPAAAGRIVSGLCSSYLCEGRELGEEVAIFFRESNFHLPKDPTIPIIMIAGGCGLSPFLSFLEERARIASSMTSNSSKPKLGPAVLYYGSRNAYEYLMRDELLAHLTDTSGNGPALSRLTVSFSSTHDWSEWLVSGATTTTASGSTAPLEKAQHANEFIFPRVQNIPNVVVADTSKLVKLMREGAHVYVCGGQGNFGNAVRNAVNSLAELVHHDELAGSSSTFGGDDHAGLRFLVKQKRYFEDLAD